MKRSIGPARLVIAFVAVGLAGFATLAEAQTLPHYTVINLGILNEGSTSNASGVTNNGWVNGDSWLAGNQNEHAVLWRPDGMGQFKITDLGTLGGLNSASAWASSSKNNRGLVVGQAQTSQIDPLGEYWGVDIGCVNNGSLCNGYQNLELGFVWQNGVMTALPTLGGNNSIANGVNNLGQVVGWAETATKDRAASRRNSWTSMLPSGAQRKARSTHCLPLRATSSRRLSGSMTTATWWARRGLVGSS
jgi:hypothetical protein